MITLAVDFATLTGWALFGPNGLLSGVVEFNQSRANPHATMWLNAWWWLENMHQLHGITRVVQEAPIVYGRGTNSYRAAFGLAATCEAWCEYKGVIWEERAPTAIKKHATGKGNAKKDQMLVAAARRWPGQEIKTHDQADALWLLDMVLRGEANT